MKVIAFSYTDSKGKQTNRQVMVVSEPTKNVAAIDLEGLSDASIQGFVTSYNKLYDEFMAKVAELKSEWPDCEFKFRNFKSDNMENVVAKYI